MDGADTSHRFVKFGQINRVGSLFFLLDGFQEGLDIWEPVFWFVSFDVSFPLMSEVVQESLHHGRLSVLSLGIGGQEREIRLCVLSEGPSYQDGRRVGFEIEGIQMELEFFRRQCKQEFFTKCIRKIVVISLLEPCSKPGSCVRW